MARRRTKTPEIVLDQDLEPTVTEAAPVTETAAPRVRRPFIRVPLDERGVPSLSSLDPEKRAALVSAVGQLPEQAQVDPALAGMLISAIAQLEAAVLAPRFKLAREEMARIAQPRPPLDELLAKQTATVLSKHNVFGRFGDELALAALIISWQASVLQAANEISRAKAQAAKVPETKHSENVSNVQSEG